MLESSSQNVRLQTTLPCLSMRALMKWGFLLTTVVNDHIYGYNSYTEHPPYIVHNHSELGWDTLFVAILEVVKLLIQYVFLPGQYFFIANTNSLPECIETNYKRIKQI